jgi:hypothetical protein
VARSLPPTRCYPASEIGVALRVYAAESRLRRGTGLTSEGVTLLRLTGSLEPDRRLMPPTSGGPLIFPIPKTPSTGTRRTWIATCASPSARWWTVSTTTTSSTTEAPAVATSSSATPG